MKRALYIMIGGFLGAGKTSSILQLAEFLKNQNKTVGVITNDQAQNLVDTQLIQNKGHSVKEIAGGCFCCRFSSLKDAADHLNKENAPDIFLAEPVGSCTDLVATVSYPLRRMYGQEYAIAPLSVIIDAKRALRVFGLNNQKAFSDKINYIYHKQIEEAQVLVVNKIDLINEEEKALLENYLKKSFDQKMIFWLSVKNKLGLNEWFENIIKESSDIPNVLDIDYKTYAEGEAELGWLNASLEIISSSDFDGNEFLKDFTHSLKIRLNQIGEIAHLKLTLKPREDDFEMASIQIVGHEEVPELGLSLMDETQECDLIINARIESNPENIKQCLDESIKEYKTDSFNINLIHQDHFAPAAPSPEYRMEQELV